MKNQSYSKLTTNSILYESLLIAFPIWIPALYLIIIFNFPTMQMTLLLFTFLILGELHFGITWLFFFDKKNRRFINENYIYSYIIPIAMVAFFVICWFYISNFLAFFLSTLFNIFHVTRQSVGITKLYSNKLTIKNISLLVYFNSALFLGYGFIKTFLSNYINILIIDFYLYLSILSIISTILFCLYLSIINFKLNFVLTCSVITGSLLYAPFLLNIDPLQAGAIGIGMHYIQYITLQFIIFYRKNINSNTEKINYINLFNRFYGIVLYLVLYVIIMGGLLYYGRNYEITDNLFKGEFNFLFFIPFILHNLHFYADMFIWKFSNPHIRNNIGKFLFV